MVKFELQPTF